MACSQRKEVEDQLQLLIESSDYESKSENSDSDNEIEWESSDSDEETENMLEVENVEDFNDEINWTDKVKNDLLTPEKELVFNTGPVHDLPSGSTPLQFLKLFFTDDICEAFRLNINTYAELEQKRKNSTDIHWKPIEDIQELWRFFSIILICGVIRVPKLKHYWSSNDMIGNQAVKRLMSRNRFQKILQYFHIVDEDNDGSFNFTQTVEPIMDNLRERFLTHFKPPRELLVKEAFFKNKVRMGMFKRRLLKRRRSGLKIWTLSSPDGYIFNFDLFIGKNGKIERSKYGVGHGVVNRLLTPIETKGHHIYFDGFFSSIPLMMDIYKGGHRACGYIRIDRKCMPKELKSLKLKKFMDSRHFQCIQCPDLLCCVWFDYEQHCVVSTNSKMEFVEVETRQGNDVVGMDCPSMIDKYSTYMGGVEKAFHKRNRRNPLSRSSKWWRYLFWFLVNSCVNNAYLVYASTNRPQIETPKRIYEFKLAAVEEILDCMVVSSLRNCSLEARNSTSGTSSRPDLGPAAATHQKVKIKGKKRACTRCNKLKRRTAANYYVLSSFMCDTCHICLCASCFEVYHSENQMEFS